MTIINPEIDALAKRVVETRTAYDEAKMALYEAIEKLTAAVAPVGDGQ